MESTQKSYIKMEKLSSEQKLLFFGNFLPATGGEKRKKGTTTTNRRKQPDSTLCRNLAKIKYAVDAISRLEIEDREKLAVIN